MISSEALNFWITSPLPHCAARSEPSGCAGIIARTGLDPWDAHAAAIADMAIYPILTLDAAKWRQPSADLDEPLHIVEISDPEERDPEEKYACSLTGYHASLMPTTGETITHVRGTIRTCGREPTFQNPVEYEVPAAGTTDALSR